MSSSLYDILKGTTKPQKSAEEVESEIFAELERLGGGGK